MVDHNKEVKGDGDCDLDAFFDEVEAAAAAEQKPKKILLEDPSLKQRIEPTSSSSSSSIRLHKVRLGTAQEQIDRIMPIVPQKRPSTAPPSSSSSSSSSSSATTTGSSNSSSVIHWRNLNPFHVLDLPHTASCATIARQYKALSLLLHPDKTTMNMHDHQQQQRQQEAYDQVLKAKAALLDDEVKRQHIQQLVEQGMQQGLADFQQQQKQQTTSSSSSSSMDTSPRTKMSLQDCQTKATQRIFADIEYARRRAEALTRSNELRQQQQLDHEAAQHQRERALHQHWQQADRVHQRVNNWRDFHSCASSSASVSASSSQTTTASTTGSSNSKKRQKIKR